MVDQVISNTFLSTYKDDFRDSDNFHRILFNNGRALQARELTQLQTIINKEIQRLGSYFFKESSIITGNLGSAQLNEYAVFFAKLDTSINTLPSDYKALEGTYFTNAAGIKGLFLKVIPATDTDPATIIYSIVDGADEARAVDTTLTSNFSNGDNLTIDGGTLTIQTVNTVANPATGRSSIIDLPQTETFTTGHFVFTPAQSLVIGKYTDTPTDTVVYTVSEDIVTVDDDLALYDNAGSTPNLTSPGADRYRIRLTLDLLSNINTSTTTFIPLIKIRSGIAEPLQFPDSILNRLGDLIATRTFDINGDFIVNDGKDKYKLTILKDSDDDYLRYQVGTGTSFIAGRRYENVVPKTIRTKKPRTVPDDVRTVTSENVVFEYGNYFLADSSFGLLSKPGDLSTVNLYDKKHKAASATTLGTARIRNIEKLSSGDFKLYMFDVKLDSNGSGTLYDIVNTKSIGTDSANYANLITTENKVQLLEPDKNTLIHPLPRFRAQEISGDISLTVADVLTTTSNVSGVAVFNTAATDEDFVDESEWLLQVDSSGAILDNSQFTISSGGAGSNSVTITGAGTNTALTLLCYVNTAGDIIAKTRATQAESLSVVNNTVSLTKPDFIDLTSVIDDTTSENITYKFYIDKPVNGSFYQTTTLKLNSGFTAPAGTVTVTYRYFDGTGAGDFYAVNSYNSVDYADIPTVQRRKGASSLADALDFRSTKDVNGSYTRVVRIPRNRDVVTLGKASYYNARVDLLYIDIDGVIRVKKGVSAVSPEAPKAPPSVLPLHYAYLNAYTYSANDVTTAAIIQNGYKMEDIRALEKRISNVEYLTSLTISELNLNSLSVIDENGLERSKVGIYADNFKEHNKALIAGNIDYRAGIHRSQGILRPRVLKKHMELYYDSDLSINTVRKGATVWPKYEEEVLLNQTIASGPTNVNQTQLAKFVGSTTLVPDVDTWTIRRTLDKNNVDIAIHGDLSEHDDFQEY